MSTLRARYDALIAAQAHLEDYQEWAATYDKPRPALVDFLVGQNEDARDRANAAVIAAIASTFIDDDAISGLTAALKGTPAPFSGFNDYALGVHRIRSGDNALVIEVRGPAADRIGLAIASLLNTLCEGDD